MQVPIQIPPPPPQASTGCMGPGGKPRESTPMIHGPSSIGFRHQESSQGGWGSGEESPPPNQDYPTDTGQHHHSATSTIRRKSKRDRNKTTCVVTSERTGNCVSASYSHHTLPHGGSGGKTGNNIACNKTNTKGRSKSRSPGRRGGGMDRAIVIVHHTTCAHHSRSREPSPDNLSESSLSYTQDNELMSGESGEGSDMVIPPMPPVRTSSVDHLMHADTTAPPAAWMDGPVGELLL